LIDAAIPILAFLFGLLIGSFLNVCIYRWPRDLSVVRPRSRCPLCESGIAWYDNIPLLSYAVLRGKCRHCGGAISRRYPMVELLTGLAFLFFALRSPSPAEAVKMCVLAAMLIGLMFSDLETRILPDEFTLGGALAGVAFAAVRPMPPLAVPLISWWSGVEFSPRVASLLESALGAVAPAACLWFVGWAYLKLRRREGLGFGDVKLLALTGAFLGLGGAFMALFCGSVAGSILGYGYVKITGKDVSSYELPFGSFLAAAALAMAMSGAYWGG
jgi:leader peptidase (prepilin peptidase) / N-methyltransferase